MINVEDHAAHCRKARGIIIIKRVLAKRGGGGRCKEEPSRRENPIFEKRLPRS